MKEPKKVYLTEVGMECLQGDDTATASNFNHGQWNIPYHSDTALREFIEENKRFDYREVEVIDIKRLLKCLNEQ
jgi:hypothetical protein